MAPSKKLSIYLNRYHSYHNIKNAEPDKVHDITFEYIQDAEDKIFKQPVIALRAIKVEMIDILIHYDNYVKEIETYINELDAIVSKGPRLNEIDLEKVKALEKRRDVLANFLYSLDDSLALMMRMLMEHYSELERDKPFLDKFSKYLSPFDWMSKRAKGFRNEFVMKADHDLKPVPFEEAVTKEAKQLIANDDLEPALNLLLSNVQDQIIEKELISLIQQWKNFNKEKNLGILSDESSKVIMNKIVQGVLSII